MPRWSRIIAEITRVVYCTELDPAERKKLEVLLDALDAKDTSIKDMIAAGRAELGVSADDPDKCD